MIIKATRKFFVLNDININRNKIFKILHKVMVQINITCKNLFRIIYILLAVIIIAFGVFSIITLSGTPTQYMFRAYNILFGLLLIIAEFKIALILKYFNFLRRFLGKGIWCFLIASSWLNTEEWYNYAMALGFAGVGVIFIFMQFIVSEEDEDDMYKEANSRS